MPSTQTRESLSPTAHEPRGRSEGSLSLLPMCVCRGSILREEFGYILGSGYRLRKRSAAPPKVAARGRIAVRAAVLAFTDTPARSIQPNLFPLRVLCAFTAFARLQQNLDNTSSPPSSAPQSAQDTSQSSTGRSAGEQKLEGCIMRAASTYYIQPSSGVANAVERVAGRGLTCWTSRCRSRIAAIQQRRERGKYQPTARCRRPIERFVC